MPQFDYYVNNGAGSFTDSSGSGLGFFGAGGFGSSMAVDEKNNKTYVTDGAGTSQGPEAWNVKWTHPASGLIGQTGSGLPLTSIPNNQATFNLRFTHSSAVLTTAPRLYCYDRYSVNNPPSGVTVYAAEIAHPDTAQTATGSGSATWTQLSGTGSYLTLTASPGASGFRPLGASTSDARHDWYIAVSCEADSIGSKTQFGFVCELDYL